MCSKLRVNVDHYPVEPVLLYISVNWTKQYCVYWLNIGHKCLFGAIAMNSELVDISILEPRWVKIQDWLSRRDLGALLVYSPAAEHKWGQNGHVAYLTGWANHDRIVESAVVVPLEGHPVLLFAGLSYMLEQIGDVSPVKDVRLVRAIDPNAVAVDSKTVGGTGPRSFAEEAKRVMHENNIFGKKVGIAGIENMPVPFYEHLCDEFGENLVRGGDIVAKIRAVKTPDEIELIKHAAHLGDIGFRKLVEISKPGMKGIEIVAEMEHAVRKEGADHAKYWIASGPATVWEDVKLDIRPHLRVLQDGDFINTCSYIVYKGYWSHGHRVGTMGVRSEYIENNFQIAVNAQNAGINGMYSGNRAGNIARAIRENCESAGWSLLGGRVGHGIGLDYSERPSPSESNDDLLEVGNTVVLHSAFALPDSGKMFVPLGDHVHVGESGPEFLMEFPRDPFIANG